ncbi:MAG TPA: helix-hairpin-helix domain-containing protein [Steroidobacteraceae bacterium]|nr:helix-hairpin-helix domain-containing protein [Steroidobacteraceae bacterium]
MHTLNSPTVNNKVTKSRLLALAIISALFAGVTTAGPVDINRADAVTIAKELNGIGTSLAKAIVDYRDKNGAFKSVDDVSKVKGVGMKVLEKNRANIKLSAVEPAKKS